LAVGRVAGSLIAGAVAGGAGTRSAFLVAACCAAASVPLYAACRGRLNVDPAM